MEPDLGEVGVGWGESEGRDRGCNLISGVTRGYNGAGI